MRNLFLLIMQAAVLAACADWPEQSAALDQRALGLTSPRLLPQDQLLVTPNTVAEAAGAALASRAATLRGVAAGL